jgi:DNA integrity scanning protein DisA with diadenylate cyclase activity
MEENVDLLDDILIQERSINLQTLSDVITLAVEIAREGRGGRRIGTLFVISDEETVLASPSRSFSTRFGIIQVMKST